MQSLHNKILKKLGMPRKALDKMTVNRRGKKGNRRIPEQYGNRIIIGLDDAIHFS
jgi:hypothetical protein